MMCRSSSEESLSSLDDEDVLGSSSPSSSSCGSLSRSDSASAGLSVHPVASREPSEATLRTLRYHYLLKFYIPLHRLLQSRRHEREEIRRRLAMNDEDFFSGGGGGDRAAKKPNLGTRLQTGMSLQICYVNDEAAREDSPPTSTSSSTTCSRRPGAASSLTSSSVAKKVRALSSLLPPSPQPFFAPLASGHRAENFIGSVLEAAYTPLVLAVYA
jgi:hypothetical protein